MKLKLALLVGLFAFGSAMSASAGAILDNDSDLVPDQFDNCRTHANGPNQTTNQVDSDLDGYGNRCDADFSNTPGNPPAVPADTNGNTNVADFGIFLLTFGQPTLGETDMNGDGICNVADFGLFLQKFSAPSGPNNQPGPSGLACATPAATNCTP